jgi:hypothetical protein
VLFIKYDLGNQTTWGQMTGGGGKVVSMWEYLKYVKYLKILGGG